MASNLNDVAAKIQSVSRDMETHMIPQLRAGNVSLDDKRNTIRIYVDDLQKLLERSKTLIAQLEVSQRRSGLGAWTQIHAHIQQISERLNIQLQCRTGETFNARTPAIEGLIDTLRGMSNSPLLLN
ncbi:hypothetical protein EUX98_g5191 [Antrodiella citrinella]|uniref:Uncharacterized protein n=1 Tax=Antrodiella citrinella TaxID=2447956 RepID=A0A4S4MT47_9APHY|nr:hypothetical protein EUX98_g5191 [Antrodiella citrinella]